MKKQRKWILRLLSVPLMILFILAVYGFKVPNPMIILIIPVVYFTYSGGYICGVLGGATSITYALYFFLIKTADPAGAYKVITIVLAIVSIILLVGKLKARDEKNTKEMQRRGDALVRMATTDKLTGASNRHAFFDMANSIYENSRQRGAPLSLLFIDIDHFKQINDHYGHGFGDVVLARLAENISGCLRGSDINCRYGGEEFVILLANADKDAAQLVAHRIMEKVRQIRFEEYPDFHFTVSIGVSSMVPSSPRGLDLLIRSADSAMYQAKQTGRNRVVAGDPHGSADSGEGSCPLRFAPISRCSDADASEEVNYLTQDILMHTLDQMLELVYVVDVETYELLYINSAGREQYGIGNPKSGKCYELIQGLEGPCSFCLTDRLAYDSVYTWEFTNRKLNRHFLLRDRLVHWNGRKARMQIATDITEQVEERRTLKNLLEAEGIVRECIGLLYETKNLPQAMGHVLRRAGEYFGVDRAYFFQPAGEVLALQNEWRADGLTSDNRFRELNMERFNRWRSLSKTKEYIVMEDIALYEDWSPEVYQKLRLQGVKSLVTMPLERDGDLVGLWGMENPSPEKLRDIVPFLLSLRYFLLSTMHRIEYEERLQKLSFEDGLTGVYNRNSYLQDMAKFSSTGGTGAAYITINELKSLNDAYGHAYGDEILIRCARTLAETFPSGAVYRVGGDEFTVICKDISRERFEDCVRAFEARCTCARECHAAVGYKWARQTDDIQGLVQAAEAWMYEDKKKYYRKTLPSDRYRHYHDDVFGLREPGALEKRLNEGSFTVYLQPKVAIRDRSVSGAEALVRYRQADDSIIAPIHFIPVLEDARLVGMLDFFVFDFICGKLAQWIAEGRKAVPISVNFSRYTLAEPDFLPRLKEVFGKYGIAHQWVIIELTESVKGVEGLNLLALINDIREAGFIVAIDDFGADYSNLSLFASAGFDELKVDKSLVDGIVANPKTQMVIASVMDLCRRMGIRVIAEGVETEEQFGILKQNGCEQAQGYLFSRPVPVREYEETFMSFPINVSFP